MKIVEKFNDSSIMDSLKEHSPLIFTVIGVAGIGAGAFLTWKAARKHDQTINDIKNNIQEVKDQKPREASGKDGKVISYDESEGVTIKDYRKNLTIAYAKAGLTMAKLYGPALMVDILSLGLILNSYKTLSTNCTAALADATMANNMLSKYRKRVIDTLGEEADKEFRLGIKEKVIETPVTDENGEVKTDKNGNIKMKKEKVEVLDYDLDPSATYAMIFSRETSKNFEYDRELGRGDDTYNEMFLRRIEDVFNNKLHTKDGNHVWLSEICDEIGFEVENESWRYAGWYFDRKHPIGDNKIDLRIQPIYTKDGINTGAFLIDPNVDGNIMKYVFRNDRNRNA